MKQYETFGQALFRLMQDREMTVKKLTNLMNIKSSNTIARLLADKSSPNKIRSFYNDLVRINPLQLVGFEKEQLEEAIEISAEGADLYMANKQMLHFLQERSESPACICKQAFAGSGLFIDTLDDLLQSYLEFKTVSIMLQNCALGGVTRALKLLLEKCDGMDITIEHYVSANEGHTKEVKAFINLLDVMGHPDYSIFFSPYSYNSRNDFYNVYNNLMIVLKSDKDGNRFTDIITFHSENSFTVLHNIPGNNSYEFHMAQFHALRLQHNPVWEIQENSCDLSGILNYNSRLLELDTSRPLISVRTDISMCMVPPEIVLDTLDLFRIKKNSDENELFRRYQEVINIRHQNFIKPVQPQMYLFSKAGIYNFLKEGKSKANVFGFRDLVPEESRRVISSILDVAGHSSATTFHLMKNELRYNNITYLLYGKDTLLIDNYPGFQNYDARQSYNSCFVSTSKILNSFSGFLNNELLSRYVYTQEETIAFLKSLLS